MIMKWPDSSRDDFNKGNGAGASPCANEVESRNKAAQIWAALFSTHGACLLLSYFYGTPKRNSEFKGAQVLL